MFTKEQIEQLRPFEPNLKTIVQSHYTRCMTFQDVTKIRKIYEKATGKPYQLHYNCQSCVTALLTAVGVNYFSDKQKFEQEALLEQGRKRMEEQEQKKARRQRRVRIETAAEEGPLAKGDTETETEE